MVEVKAYSVTYGTLMKPGTVLFLALDEVSAATIGDAAIQRIEQYLRIDAPCCVSVLEGTYRFSDVSKGEICGFVPDGDWREMSRAEAEMFFSFRSPCKPGFTVVRELKPSLLCRTLSLQACYRCDDKNCGDNQAKAPAVDVDSVEFFVIS